MMTRTSAQDYVKSKIYMTCVDTGILILLVTQCHILLYEHNDMIDNLGWINDEKPIELAVKHELKHNFQTPIDELDAASRVCIIYY